MNAGFIKLNRSLLQSEITEHGYKSIGFFVALLLKTEYKDYKNGKAGSFTISKTI